MNEKKTLLEQLGGRKAMGFYASLLACFSLAVMGKAETEILGLIDTLYLVFAGANVAVKRTEAIAQKAIEKQQIKTEKEEALS